MLGETSMKWGGEGVGGTTKGNGLTILGAHEGLLTLGIVVHKVLT